MVSFDPYLNWLGIPPHEQPPNFYRLLGVVLFESNPEVIQQAADRQSLRVGRVPGGPARRDVPAIAERDRHGTVLPAGSPAKSGIRRHSCSKAWPSAANVPSRRPRRRLGRAARAIQCPAAAI